MNLDSLWNLALAASLRGSALIVAVLVLRWVSRRWVPAQCFHLLWLLVALKLLVPIAPTAPWSVFNLRLPAASAAAQPTSDPAWRVTLDTAPEATPAFSTPPATLSARASTAAEPARVWSAATAVPLVWLCGVLIQAGLLTRGAWRLRRVLRRAALCVDPRVRDAARAAAAQLGLRRLPPMLETDAAHGPAVVGTFRPRLLLPVGLAARLSDEELHLVLAHELAHVWRRDLAGLWLMALARTLHWFNPLVWLAAHCGRIETELACDETVLRSAASRSAESYGAALLHLAQVSPWRTTPLPMAGIVESKRALRERLHRVAGFQAGSPRRLALTATVVLAVGLAFGANETAPPKPESAAIPAAVASPTPSATSDAPPQAPATPSPTVTPAPAPTPVAPADPEFAKGWTVTALSLSQRINDAVIYVRIRRADGEEFTLLSSGASHRGVVLERVDWKDANRPQIVLRKGKATATLPFPTAPVSETTPAKFAEHWKVVGISKPAPHNEGGLEVGLETNYGATMNLRSGRKVEGGFWAEVKEPADPTLGLEVALHHGAETTLLSADRSLIAVRAYDQSMQPQIEIESMFIEVASDALAKFKEPELLWLKPPQKPERATALNVLPGNQQWAFKNTRPELSGVFTAEEMHGVARAMNGKRGVELLSAPKVTTKSGQRAVIEIIREFRYPVEWELDKTGRKIWTPTKFETKNCGVTLEVEATLGPDGKTIDLRLTPQVIDCLGFVDFVTRKAIALPKAPKKAKLGTPPVNLTDLAPNRRLVPIFSERKIATDVSIFDGQTVVLGAVRETANTKPFKSVEADRQLAVLVTARRINRDGQPFPAQAAAPATTTPASASSSPADAPAAALPVPEKPGYVRSPYAPDAGFIDVRGFPPGTEVKCPYSGKILRLP